MTEKTLTLELTEEESNLLQNSLSYLIDHCSDLADYERELVQIAMKNNQAQYDNQLGATWKLHGET